MKLADLHARNASALKQGATYDIVCIIFVRGVS